MKKNKLSSDTVISTSAIVIALVSVFLTVWQGVEFRKHNRLSVQPRLDISYGLDYFDSLAQLIIINNGLGPAIIDEVVAEFNTTEFKINRIDEFSKFQKQLGLAAVPITYEILEQGSTIVPNDSKTILQVDIKHLNEIGLPPPSLLNECNIVIKYKSLYDEEFSVHNMP